MITIIRKRCALVKVFFVILFFAIQVWLVMVACGEEIYLTNEFHYETPVEMAIFPFRDDTSDDKLGWISGNITGNLIAKFISSDVIKLSETEQLRNIVDELGLSVSDLAPEKTLKMGKIRTVKVIVCGSYYKISKSEINIIVRFTDVETGTIILIKEKRGHLKDIENVIEQFSQELLLFIERLTKFNIKSTSTIKNHNTNSVASQKKKSQGNWATFPVFIFFLGCLILLYSGINHAS